MIILIDDIGAFLEGNCPWEVREARCALFEKVLCAVFKAFNGDEKALTVVRGHEFKCEGYVTLQSAYSSVQVVYFALCFNRLVFISLSFMVYFEADLAVYQLFVSFSSIFWPDLIPLPVSPFSV